MAIIDGIQFDLDDGELLIQNENGKGFARLIVSKLIWIDVIYVYSSERNKGTGTRLLKAICDYADRLGLGVGLQVSPENITNDDMTYDDLIDWYKSYGFKRKPIRNGCIFMSRKVLERGSK